jgi:ATP-dependent 26S proteasome regulatory subunit
LASKISPCVIFIDEVDSILGRRSKSGEHEARFFLQRCDTHRQ